MLALTNLVKVNQFDFGPTNMKSNWSIIEHLRPTKLTTNDQLISASFRMTNTHMAVINDCYIDCPLVFKRQPNLKLMPLLLNTPYSFPSKKNLVDYVDRGIDKC